MAVIYLKHPTHGAKVAISDEEARQDERNGWFRFSVDDNSPVVHTNQLAAPRRRKQVDAQSDEEN